MGEWFCGPADLREAQLHVERHLERAGPQLIHRHVQGAPCVEACGAWPPAEEAP